MNNHSRDFLICSDYIRIFWNVGFGFAVLLVTMGTKVLWFGWCILLLTIIHAIYEQKRVIVDQYEVSILFFMRPFNRTRVIPHKALDVVKWQSGPYTGSSYVSLKYVSEDGSQQNQKIPLSWSQWSELIRLIKLGNPRVRFIP